MIKKPLYTFDNISATGLDQVPLNNLILIESDGSGSPKLILYTDNSGIDHNTTISGLLALTSQYEEVTGAASSGGDQNIDAGRADTVYGGTITIDCGGAA